MTSPVNNDSPRTPTGFSPPMRLPPISIPPTQTQCHGCKAFFAEGKEKGRLMQDKVYLCALCALKLHYGFEDENPFTDLPPIAKPHSAKKIDFNAEVLKIVPFTLKEMVNKALSEQKDK